MAQCDRGASGGTRSTDRKWNMRGVQGYKWAHGRMPRAAAGAEWGSKAHDGGMQQTRAHGWCGPWGISSGHKGGSARCAQKRRKALWDVWDFTCLEERVTAVKQTQ
ncbi:hypothetical protein JB92DRAFT_2833720 [Gautieria morchelliformis]|nr:hypothetical protein JB92DRAFT_2833720 [Gautieria morchelliformis]